MIIQKCCKCSGSFSGPKRLPLLLLVNGITFERDDMTHLLFDNRWFKVNKKMQTVKRKDRLVIGQKYHFISLHRSWCSQVQNNSWKNVLEHGCKGSRLVANWFKDFMPVEWWKNNCFFLYLILFWQLRQNISFYQHFLYVHIWRRNEYKSKD